MKAHEITQSTLKWERERTGPSPLIGNHKVVIDNLFKEGKVARDLIGVFDNGIHVYGYKDHQNRLISTSWEGGCRKPLDRSKN